MRGCITTGRSGLCWFAFRHMPPAQNLAGGTPPPPTPNVSALTPRHTKNGIDGWFLRTVAGGIVAFVFAFAVPPFWCCWKGSFPPHFLCGCQHQVVIWRLPVTSPPHCLHFEAFQPSRPVVDFEVGCEWNVFSNATEKKWDVRELCASWLMKRLGPVTSLPPHHLAQGQRGEVES